MAAHTLKGAPKPPTSRLLRGLDARVAAARTRVEADCVRAERAVYLARQGAHAEAVATLRELRLRYDTRPNIAIAVWVNLCEGIASHFCDMGADAAAKIRRAHALAEASRLPQLCALTAAWSAHMAYLDAAFEPMTGFIGQALTLADASNHGARSRACLVAAQAFHVAGQAELARPWYEATRRHAVDDGDDATLGALLHNAAWLRAIALRQDVLLRGASATPAAQALMAADSARHFDRLVGATSLASLAPMLRAQLLAVFGRPADAIALYDAHFERSVAEGVGRNISAELVADRAWCHAAVGDSTGARHHADAALAHLVATSHCGGRVLAHKRLAQVFEQLGDPERAAAQHALCAVAWTGHRADQARILALLDETLRTHPP